MRRSLLSAFGLSLLLTACRSNDYQPVELSMTDPNVLSGQWQGQLVQQHNLHVVRASADRLYLLDGGVLELRDTGTGTLLQRRSLPPNQYAGYRAAWRDDGVLLVLIDQELLKFDANLTPLPNGVLPPIPNVPDASTYDWSLSGDGNILMYRAWDSSKRLAYSTRTGEKIDLPTAYQGTAQFGLSSDLRWAVLSSVSGNAAPLPIKVVNVVTGAAFDLNTHAVAADCQANPYETRIESVQTSGGQERLLVTYPDGYTEVRDATGQMLRQITTLPCQSVALTAIPGTPDQVTYSVRTIDSQATPSKQVEAGILNMTTGTTLQHYTPMNSSTATETATPTTTGLLIRREPVAGAGATSPSYRFQNWAGSSWGIATAQYYATLHLNTVRVSDTEANVTGTADWNGRRLTVVGNLKTWDAVLKPQARAFTPSLQANLNLMDGTLKVGSLYLTNDLAVKSISPPVYDATKTPTYRASWSEPDVTLALGALTRP